LPPSHSSMMRARRALSSRQAPSSFTTWGEFLEVFGFGLCGFGGREERVERRFKGLIPEVHLGGLLNHSSLQSMGYQNMHAQGSCLKQAQRATSFMKASYSWSLSTDSSLTATFGGWGRRGRGRGHKRGGAQMSAGFEGFVEARRPGAENGILVRFEV
jgi:hypothetical protein